MSWAGTRESRNPKILESPIFIPLDFDRNSKLFAHMYFPDSEPKIGYVFLNPLFEEKKMVQQFQAQLARSLVNQGAAVLRFDYFARA